MKGSTVLPCTSDRPCNLAFALANAGPGDDVGLAPGNYRPPALNVLQSRAPYAETLVVNAGVVLHGEPGAALPVIHSRVPVIAPAVRVSGGGVMRDVAIEATAPDGAGVNYGYGATIEPNALVERCGGWVDVAANLPGDMAIVEVGATPLFIQRGSYIASEDGVELDTTWGGFTSVFGGEGGFLQRATGQGSRVLSCYGALDRVHLADGESLVVDSGHMIAFAETMSFETRRAAKSKTIQSVTSGEGFAMEFHGPGELMIQSRNPSALVDWLTTVLPFSRS